jgi:hypothetical protein
LPEDIGIGEEEGCMKPSVATWVDVDGRVGDDDDGDDDKVRVR